MTFSESDFSGIKFVPAHMARSLLPVAQDAPGLPSDIPPELVKAMLRGAVDAIKLDGSEDCTKAELTALLMDLTDALYLDDAEECVMRIVGRPDLLEAAEGIRGYRTFAHKQERFAMVSAEVARREINQILK